MAKKKEHPADVNHPSITAKMAFGQLLSELRAEMTQADLEAISGVSRSFIGELETGKKQVCLENLIRLAFALDVAPGTLVDRVIERMDAEAVKALRAHS